MAAAGKPPAPDAGGAVREKPPPARASLLAWASFLAASLPAVLAPPEAQGKEVWASESGDSVLEIRAFYKAYGAAVRLQGGLVEGTEALARLADQARLEHPELSLPRGAGALPLYGATSAHSGRAWGRMLLKNRVELALGYQLDALVASDRAFVAAGGALGSAVPISGRQAASRRLVDFDHVLADRGGFLLQHNLDLLAVKVLLPRGEIAAGRQVLSWGTGRFWSPTDLLSPFAPTDVDREVRRGVDALRLSFPLSTTSLLDVLWLPQQQGWAQGGVVRAQANFGGFDLSLSAAKYLGDLVFGADTAGDIGPVAVHAEAAYTLGLRNLDGSGPVKVGDHFLRAVAGLEWQPTEDLILLGEYYFNGFGASDPAQYALKLSSDRVARGEIFGAGRHYLALGAVLRATDLLSVQATVIGNLTDPSAIAVPALEYWLEQSVILRAGGYIPIGKPPDPRSLQGLTVSDLIGQTNAYSAAVSSLGLRSEHGTSPWGLFAQVGVYF